MSEQPSAVIIPFPSRLKPNELTPSVERLAHALTSLSQALTEQREALRRWRDALQALSDKVGDQHAPTRD